MALALEIMVKLAAETLRKEVSALGVDISISRANAISAHLARFVALLATSCSLMATAPGARSTTLTASTPGSANLSESPSGPRTAASLTSRSSADAL